MAAGAIVNLAAGSGPKWSRWATYGMASVASALVAATGALCVTGHVLTVDLGNLLDFGQTMLRLDPLAGLFLTLMGGLGLVISLSLLNWPAPTPAGTRASGWAYMLLLAAVTVVVVASDVFTFLFAWEALTVAFYVLTLATRANRDQPSAAWATVGVGAWGGASLLVGFLLLAGAAHSFAFAPWARSLRAASTPPPTPSSCSAFRRRWAWPRSRAGCHAGTRQPRAGSGGHGRLGRQRRLLWSLAVPRSARPPPELVGRHGAGPGRYHCVSGHNVRRRPIGPQSSHRLFQHRERRAHHGRLRDGPCRRFGRQWRAHRGRAPGRVAPDGRRTRWPNQGFSWASANFQPGANGAPLSGLSGTLHTQGWASAAFAASALTLAGLPPTIGFVSEWFTFEALMQQFRLSSLPLRLATATAGALVALTAGVAALTFVRLLGFVVLGRGRAKGSRKVDRPAGGHSGQRLFCVLAWRRLLPGRCAT